MMGINDVLTYTPLRSPNSSQAVNTVNIGAEAWTAQQAKRMQKRLQDAKSTESPLQNVSLYTQSIHLLATMTRRIDVQKKESA